MLASWCQNIHPKTCPLVQRPPLVLDVVDFVLEACD